MFIIPRKGLNFRTQVLIRFTKFHSPSPGSKRENQKSDILCSNAQYLSLNHVHGGESNVINCEASQYLAGFSSTDRSIRKREEHIRELKLQGRLSRQTIIAQGGS